jgi:hypothetical protein
MERERAVGSSEIADARPTPSSIHLRVPAGHAWHLHSPQDLSVAPRVFEGFPSCVPRADLLVQVPSQPPPLPTR